MRLNRIQLPENPETAKATAGYGSIGNCRIGNINAVTRYFLLCDTTRVLRNTYYEYYEEILRLLHFRLTEHSATGITSA